MTSSSTINVRRVTYTVPSRLNGETLRIHLYHDRLCCYLGSVNVENLKRIYPTGKSKRARNINYKHVIKSLVRKPQAFRYSQLRDDLLPTERYKQIWSYLDEVIGGKSACKMMVELLSLAAEADCEKSLADDVWELIQQSLPIDLKKIRARYIQNIPQKTIVPSIQIKQHELKDYDHLIHINFISDEHCNRQEISHA